MALFIIGYAHSGKIILHQVTYQELPLFFIIAAQITVVQYGQSERKLTLLSKYRYKLAGDCGWVCTLCHCTLKQRPIALNIVWSHDCNYMPAVRDATLHLLYT